MTAHTTTAGWVFGAFFAVGIPLLTMAAGAYCAWRQGKR